MKTISKIKYVLFLLVIVGFVSCKGEIGPIGPDGTDGTNGIDGVDGEDGNANVISSDWITPAWTPLSYVVPGTISLFEYLESGITVDILNSGVVLSYIDVTGNTNIYPIPYISNSNTVPKHYTFSLVDGKITWKIDTQEVDFVPPSAYLLRYVIIPSSENKTTNSKQAIYDELINAGVDINNYYEVMDYYGLDY